MRIKPLFRFRLFPSKNRAGSPAEDVVRPSNVPAALVEGRFYRIWTWILPLLAGLAVGWFGMTCLTVWLDGNVQRRRPVTAASASAGPETDIDILNMTSFLASNPFRVTPMPFSENPSDEPGNSDAPVVITGDLATAILRWPMPGVGAIIESQGKQHLILVDQSFDVYTLENVNYLRAIFRKGDERVTKDFIISPVTPPGPPPDVRNRSNPVDPSGGTGSSRIVAAEAGGPEGIVSAELVREMMENPFDELKKVRLRPKEGEQGLQIQWINKDSILSQLGIQKGDVIRSINGIPFRNMADITNSLTSLMTSERFDVDIEREGKSTSLKYVVR